MRLRSLRSHAGSPPKSPPRRCTARAQHDFKPLLLAEFEVCVEVGNSVEIKFVFRRLVQVPRNVCGKRVQPACFASPFCLSVFARYSEIVHFARQKPERLAVHKHAVFVNAGGSISSFARACRACRERR